MYADDTSISFSSKMIPDIYKKVNYDIGGTNVCFDQDDIQRNRNATLGKRFPSLTTVQSMCKCIIDFVRKLISKYH